MFRRAEGEDQNEKIMDILGSEETVWLEVKNSRQCKPYLADLGVDEMITVMLPTRMVRRQMVWLGHLSNKELGMGAAAKLLCGDHWDIKALMVQSNKLVEVVFPGVSIRSRRENLCDIGKDLYRLLSRLDESPEYVSREVEIEMKIVIDRYANLLDVEWVEDIIGFWENL